MGQYYKIVNIDRRQAFHPHDFGDGIKLLEFSGSSCGTLAALAGQLIMDAQQTAPWAGCRVVVTGDYSDEGKFLPAALSQFNLYTVACGRHVGQDVDKVVADDALDPEVLKLRESLPPEWRQRFQFLSAKDCEAQLEGLGVPLKFGPWQERVYDHLVNPAFVAEQPEDLFEAFDCPPREQMLLSLSDLQRCIRMSSHESDVSWLTVVDFELVLAEATQAAKSLKVTYRNDRGAEYGPGVIKRTLNFPATQADIVRFFGVKPSTPQLPDSQKKLAR